MCDIAKETLDRVLADYPAILRITDIETDPKLLEVYKEKVPVVFIEGQETFIYKVHKATLRKKLERILEPR